MTINDIELFRLASFGNLKIPATTLIFNMSSATDCPSLKLNLCKACIGGKNFCYAMKAESGIYPSVLPYRRRQEDFWKGVSAEVFAEQVLQINQRKKVKVKKVRLNEAGDFHGQSCIRKADEIAEILSQHGIAVYCYTSRNDLDFSSVQHLVVNGSGFKKAGISNEFRMIAKDAPWPKGYAKCPMDCKVCDRCSKKGKDTFVIQH